MSQGLEHRDEPIFITLAATLADGILTGRYEAGQRVPSTTELSVFYRINPATAARAFGVLVQRGVLVKRRGLGMFVTKDACTILHRERESELLERYVDPLLRQAATLGMDVDSLTRLIRARAAAEGGQADNRARNHY